MCFNLRKMGICDIKNPPIVILFTIGGYALLCLHARCIVHPRMPRIIKTVLLRVDLVGKTSCPAPPRQFPLLFRQICVRMERIHPARSSAPPKHKGVVGIGRAVKQAKPCIIASVARQKFVKIARSRFARVAIELESWHKMIVQRTRATRQSRVRKFIRHFPNCYFPRLLYNTVIGVA